MGDHGAIVHAQESTASHRSARREPCRLVKMIVASVVLVSATCGFLYASSKGPPSPSELYGWSNENDNGRLQTRIISGPDPDDPAYRYGEYDRPPMDRLLDNLKGRSPERGQYAEQGIPAATPAPQTAQESPIVSDRMDYRLNLLFRKGRKMEDASREYSRLERQSSAVKKALGKALQRESGLQKVEADIRDDLLRLANKQSQIISEMREGGDGFTTTEAVGNTEPGEEHVEEPAAEEPLESPAAVNPVDAGQEVPVQPEARATQTQTLPARVFQTQFQRGVSSGHDGQEGRYSQLAVSQRGAMQGVTSEAGGATALAASGARERSETDAGRVAERAGPP